MSRPESPSNKETIHTTAARWLILRDRGLSATESIEYELWIAADERHAAAIQRLTSVWSLLDRIPDRTALSVLGAAARRRAIWRRTITLVSLAAAAVVVLGTAFWRTLTSPAPTSLTTTAGATARTITFADGTIVQLNAGGKVIEQFTAHERGVLLMRGEAHFSVTKNTARPFIVRAGTMQVRAVGTAFNVNLQPTGIEVIVTEGRVQLAARSTEDLGISGDHRTDAPTLGAGERALLPQETARRINVLQELVISPIAVAEMARVLSWREPLLRLGGATLAELANDFERATGKRLILADPSLAELRVGGRFRADDIDGFTHLLATTLDLDVERAADGTIVLRKKILESR
jgi:transmembrane sensor